MRDTMAEIIREDDPAAICTRKGWAKWIAESTKKRAAMRDKGGPDVPNGRLWIATRNTEHAHKFYAIECERFADAKVAAAHIMGSTDITVTPVEPEKMPPTRHQVRWVGSAARRVPDLKMQIRKVRKNRPVEEWRDVG